MCGVGGGAADCFSALAIAGNGAVDFATTACETATEEEQQFCWNTILGKRLAKS